MTPPITPGVCTSSSSSNLRLPARRASLQPEEFAPDRFLLDIHDGAADVHVAYATGAGSSKLTTDRIERGLGVRGSARNLNTIDRLLAMTAH